MSEYEEKELLRKLRNVFALEERCKICIPSSIRRFYRKLCIREWKRAHGKPIFNLDDYINGRHTTKVESDKTKYIDRYQVSRIECIHIIFCFWSSLLRRSNNRFKRGLCVTKQN